MNDAPLAVEKEHVNGKSHSDSMNRFLAAEQQSLSGLQWPMT